ncbi:MAG TPA: DNA starvation/stationary phase protection protein [Cytophagales bacterium]|nr:DNA starvation/stationary phase protection protein [Cytophagales bacterium]
MENSEITTSLNRLLANYHIHYQRSRAYHWNIKGPKFFELHTKFEEFYTDALLKIDAIAERILALGGSPISSLQEYIQNSELKEGNNKISDKEMVQKLAEDFRTLADQEKQIMKTANDTGDERTADIMNNYIAEQEKTIWMLKSFLG